MYSEVIGFQKLCWVQDCQLKVIISDDEQESYPNNAFPSEIKRCTNQKIFFYFFLLRKHSGIENLDQAVWNEAEFHCLGPH